MRKLLPLLVGLAAWFLLATLVLSSFRAAPARRPLVPSQGLEINAV